ncbi:MAG TPA: hypothetical protein VLT17_07500 [Gemmatimonadales bacterium]|nr:hypothetical protein [Gemmatimonadales bacterium]
MTDQPAHPHRHHPPQTPTPPGGRRALVEAFQNVVKSEAEKAKEARAPKPIPPHRRAAGLFVAVVIMVAAAAILVIQPGWLVAPEVPEETPQLHEASLRLAMYRAAQQIESFRRANGRLPASLPEAGADTTGVSYEAAGGYQYVLHGHSGDLELEYHSDQSLKDFLGDSYDLIRERFKR